MYKYGIIIRLVHHTPIPDAMKKSEEKKSCSLLPWLLTALFASLAFFLYKRDLRLLDLPATHDSTLVILALKPEDQDRVLHLKDFVGTVEIFRKNKSCEYLFADRIETVYKDGKTGLTIKFPPYKDIALVKIEGTDVRGDGKSPRFTSK